MDRHIDRYHDRQADIRTDRQTDRQIGGLRDRWTDGWTDEHVWYELYEQQLLYIYLFFLNRFYQFYQLLIAHLLLVHIPRPKSLMLTRSLHKRGLLPRNTASST